MADTYASKHGLTLGKIEQELGCNAETASEVIGLAEAGYRHGLQGWYPDGDFSSDADWCYGPGALIQKVEMQLDDDCGSVGDFYSEAHSQGLVDGGHVKDEA